jgi:predicted metal-dependent phosphoesterase TrpH
MSRTGGDGKDWIKVDLHIHTLDDPKDVLDYSAQQLLDRAHALGFGALAITLHDAVFDRPEVFDRAAAMGILLVPAAEVRLEGADVILLNVNGNDVARLRTFADLRALRARRGDSIFTFAPHPFYLLGGSIGRRLIREIDCFDAIEICHFHKGFLNPNWLATRVAKKYGKPLIATSDAHRLHAFGRHYTSIAGPGYRSANRSGVPVALGNEGSREAASTLSCEELFDALREGSARLTSPPASLSDFFNAVYFIFLAHPFRRRKQQRHACGGSNSDTPAEVI